MIDDLARAIALLRMQRESAKALGMHPPQAWVEFDREFDSIAQRADVAVEPAARGALWLELQALARRWRFEPWLEQARAWRSAGALEGLGLESLRGDTPWVDAQGVAARPPSMAPMVPPSRVDFVSAMPSLTGPFPESYWRRVQAPVAPIVAYPVVQAPDVVPVSARFEVSLRTRAKPPREGAVGVEFARERPGPVTIVARLAQPLADGLVLDGCDHAPLEIPEDQDSAAVSFELHATRAGTFDVAVALEDLRGVTITRVSRAVAAVDAAPDAPTIRASTWGAAVSFSSAPASGLVLKYVALSELDFRVTLQSSRAPASEPWRVKSSGFDQLVALCKKVLGLAAYARSSDREAQLEDLGAELAGAFLPTSVRAALADPMHADGTSLHVECDDAWVPWEILRVGSGARARFLGERFAITRGVTLQRLLASGRRGPATCVDALAGTNLTTAREHAALRALSGGDAVDLTTFADVRRAMREGPPAGIVHVASHGASSATDPLGSALMLSGGNLVPANVPVAEGIDAAGLVVGALVFLNACESGVPSTGSIRREETWPQVFMAGGAAACVATSWRVDNTVAGAFAEAVYQRLGRGVTLGEAVRQSRLAVRAEGDANRLAWSVYALPTFTLVPGETR